MLLACGTREALWDSCLALDDIVARRSENAASDTLATRQEHASHFVTSPPYLPLGLESSDPDELVATREAQVRSGMTSSACFLGGDDRAPTTTVLMNQTDQRAGAPPITGSFSASELADEPIEALGESGKIDAGPLTKQPVSEILAIAGQLRHSLFSASRERYE